MSPQNLSKNFTNRTVGDVFDELSTLSSPIFFRPNGGNAGDSLINLGVFTMLNERGIAYEVVTDDNNLFFLPEDAVVIFSGGGYLVPYWPYTSELIEMLSSQPYRKILLPQSVKDCDSTLLSLNERDIIFAREVVSFLYMETLKIKANLFIDHDMAFHIKLKDLENLPGLPKFYPKNIARLLLVLYHVIRSRFASKMPALRTDGESTKINRSSIFNDVSLICKFGNTNLIENKISAYFFLKVLSGYQTIQTDRLHVAIACAIAGIKVEVYNNSYHKIRGVYDYSIRRNNLYSDNVRFVDDEKIADS
jgi:exopolysaccharide biosynthesis predicted pyruvyltransferase EpsI